MNNSKMVAAVVTAPTEVSITTVPVPEPGEKQGATIRLACSWKLPAGCEAVIQGSFYGTKGGATFRNVAGSFYDFVGEPFQDTQKDMLASGSEQWGGRAAVAWAKQLAISRRFDPKISQLNAVAQALDAIYEFAQ